MLRIKQEVASSTASDKIVPLKQVSVNAKIRSFAADVIITQVFQNDESVPVEAVYCFPIEENAAIYGFVARIDDEREIVAQIKEKKAAQQEYTQALAQGHGAYLLEQDEASNDIFIISVGALKPGSQCQITISYVSELDLLHTSKKPTIRFVVPTTIAPRYSPSHKSIASPGETQVKYAESVPYTIEFMCQVEKLDQHIASVSSPSHPIKIDCNNEDMLLVTLSQQDTALDRDIIVDIELSDIRSNTIAAIDNSAVMISFIPNEQDCRRDLNNAMNEFFFVIDCSGSMEGDDKIGLARKAMLLFLKSLPVNCRFNIIRFGSHFSALFTDQVTREYNKENMSQAETLIKDMKADLGGTELLMPLRWLKENKPLTSGVRQIFLLTDGEVSNVTEVTNLCREMSEYTRIFSFGLGHSPSRALVKGLARATNGYFNFIAPQTNADIYVAEQLARALQPSMSDVYVKWNTNQNILHKVPEHASPVFVGDRLLFYALFDETMPFDHTTTVELFAGMQQQPIGLAHIDHVPSVFSSQLVMHLAAKALLRELLNDQKTIDKDLLVNISIKYGILCPYTAFIGVERRLNANSESNIDMELREVPIMISKTSGEPISRFRALSSMSSQRLPTFFHDVDSVASTMQCNMLLSRDERLDDLVYHCSTLHAEARQFYKVAPRKKAFSVSIGSVFQPAINFVSSLFTQKSTKNIAASSDLKPALYSTNDDVDQSLNNSNSSNSQTSKMIWPTDEQKLVDRFIELQQYDGLWILTADDVNQLTEKSLSIFSSSIIEKLEKNIQQSIITTAIVIILLETRCLALKTLWQTLSNKAYKRLKELLDEDESKIEQLMKDIRNQF
ncbi:unnamed protein product [Rotaria sp. Silwood1]|nr:unnamed protein product [Rotaria sp. Silwood1]CAF4698337.1 unnamed protein product [Rotaria sp. Silwood1]